MKGSSPPLHIIHLEKVDIFTRKRAEELERKETERERETQHLKGENLAPAPRVFIIIEKERERGREGVWALFFLFSSVFLFSTRYLYQG